MAETEALESILTKLAEEGELYEKLPEKKVRCFSCGHRCLIPEGKPGICRVRFNKGGTLYVPKGYIGALQIDPIEKKPFFHALPGSRALSFGMLGCDFHCAYCQNWVTSQALRDPVAGAPPELVTPESFVKLAKHHGAQVVTSTYNEPLITSEWPLKFLKWRNEKASRLLMSPMAMGRLRFWITSARGWIFTRWISKVLMTKITDLWAGRFQRFFGPSRCCTRKVFGLK